MTDAEIETVVKIMMTADRGCSHCVGNLLEKLVAAFPARAEQIASVRSKFVFDDDADEPGVRLREPMR